MNGVTVTAVCDETRSDACDAALEPKATSQMQVQCENRSSRGKLDCGLCRVNVDTCLRFAPMSS
jgi:hypothetical protein